MNRIRVLIATTRGPVAVERVTREAAPVSQVCLRRTTTVLPISSAYDAFVRAPSGVVERVFGPFDPGAFRLDLADPVDTGDSWQLGALLAHALAAAGRLAGRDDAPAAALWLTGTVDVDLGVGPVEHVAAKLDAARAAFDALAAAGVPLTLVVPRANAGAVDRDRLPPGAAVLAVDSAMPVLAAVDAVPPALAVVRPPAEASSAATVAFATASPAGSPAPGGASPAGVGPLLRGWRAARLAATLALMAGIGWLAAPVVVERVGDGTGAPYAPRSVDSRADCGGCPSMVALPGGTFEMGGREMEQGWKPAEAPRRAVTVAPFALARSEVTFDQWQACVDDGACDVLADDDGWGRGPRPVIRVSWHQARAFAAWLSRRAGRRYRLPSEAEWEYAARAGSVAPMAWGWNPEDACVHANVSDAAYDRGDPNWRFGRVACDDGFAHTAPVASFAPNAFGLHDMTGNVWEWVEDCWNDSYAGAPADGAARHDGDCARRVVRGGAWVDGPARFRVGARLSFSARTRSKIVGFRVARDAD